MKREDITALLPDISEEHLDKIMGLHGADITTLRDQLDTAQTELATAQNDHTVTAGTALDISDQRTYTVDNKGAAGRRFTPYLAN